MQTNNKNELSNVYWFELKDFLVLYLKMVRSLGHRLVIVKRAVIGSKGGLKLSTKFKL